MRKVRPMSLTIFKTSYLPNERPRISTETVPDVHRGLERIDEMLAHDRETFDCELVLNTDDTRPIAEASVVLAAADNYDREAPGFTYLETEIEPPTPNEHIVFSIALDLDHEDYGHLYLIADDGVTRARRAIHRDDGYDIVEYENGPAAREAVRTIAEWASDVIAAIPTDWFDQTDPLTVDPITADGWHRG